MDKERASSPDDSPAAAARTPIAPLSGSQRVTLVLILLSAFAFRVAGLGLVPPPLFRDEAEKGYNAWSLARTGRDYQGNRLPVFINAFGTHTSAIYQYAATPFVKFFGLSVVTTRITAAIVGTLTVLAVFLASRAMFDNLTALLAVALLAISPWHVHFSRWAQQGIFMPLLFSLAVWGAWRFRLGRWWGLPVAAAAIGLSAYAYAVGRILAPLFLLILVVVFRRELLEHVKVAALSALILAVLVAPPLYFTLTQSEAAMARFRAISIVQPDAAPQQIAGQFLVNYAKHFDPRYLVLRGDAELRHSPRGVGQIYAIELPFILAGIYFLIRYRHPATLILIGWLLIAPVAACLTRVGIPHALRSLAGVPAFAMLAAFGVRETLALLSGRKRVVLIASLIVVEGLCVAYSLYTYAVVYPRESRQAWQNGMVEALRYGLDNSGPHDTIWVSEAAGEMIVPPGAISPSTVFTAFCARIDPVEFQQSGLAESRFRVVPFSSDLNLLLTQAREAPTFTIAFVAELPGREPVAVFAERPRPQLAVGVYTPAADPAPPIEGREDR